jgi:hypothetical protein
MLTMWEANDNHALFSKLYNAKLKDTFSFGQLTSDPSDPSADNPVPPPLPSFCLFTSARPCIEAGGHFVFVSTLL